MAKRIGRPRIHRAGTRQETFYTTPPVRNALKAWCVMYTDPEERLRTGRNMTRSEAFRQMCALAQKKIERDRARSEE